MLSIGITGGIGSGKSTIARILKAMNFPVYIADTQASYLMNTHPEIRKEMQQYFGDEIYTGDGILNKTLLAGIIFENPEALARVNSIVHPRVMANFRQWTHNQSSKLLFFESAILFEAHLDTFFDQIICVTASREERIRRVARRDKSSPEAIQKRIQNQLDETEKCKRSDFIIYNDDDHMVIGQILSILNKLQK